MSFLEQIQAPSAYSHRNSILEIDEFRRLQHELSFHNMGNNKIKLNNRSTAMAGTLIFLYTSRRKVSPHVAIVF